MGNIQKTKQSSGQASRQVVTGTWRDVGYSSTKSKILSVKQLLIGGVVLCAAVALLAYGISLVVDKKNNPEDVGNTDLSKYQPQTPAQKADVAAFSGNYAGGMKILDDVIMYERDPAQRAKLYLDKSLIAYNHSKPQESLSYAQEAERAAPNVMSAIAIASAAEALGDKTLAMEMYKKVLERYGSEGGAVPDDLEYYQGKIDELSK